MALRNNDSLFTPYSASILRSNSARRVAHTAKTDAFKPARPVCQDCGAQMQEAFGDLLRCPWNQTLAGYCGRPYVRVRESELGLTYFDNPV